MGTAEAVVQSIMAAIESADSGMFHFHGEMRISNLMREFSCILSLDSFSMSCSFVFLL